MSKLIKVKTITDSRGSLSIIERILPFTVARVFYVYDMKGQRGGHRHKVTQMALIALGGQIKVNIEDPHGKSELILNSPEDCLLLAPEDWHTFEKISGNPTLVVLASHDYDANDYITERYQY